MHTCNITVNLLYVRVSILSHFTHLRRCLYMSHVSILGGGWMWAPNRVPHLSLFLHLSPPLSLNTPTLSHSLVSQYTSSLAPPTRHMSVTLQSRDHRLMLSQITRLTSLSVHPIHCMYSPHVTFLTSFNCVLYCLVYSEHCI